MKIRHSYAFYLSNSNDNTFKAAEIGVREGFNAYEMLNLTNKLEKLVLIDPYGIGNEQYENGMYENGMKELLKPFWDRCDFHKTTSIEGAKLFDDRSFDYVYIDGDHEKNSVYEDMETWFPKVKKFGVLAGHDWWYKGVKEGVIEFAKKNNCRIMVTEHIFHFPGLVITQEESLCQDWWFVKLV